MGVFGLGVQSRGCVNLTGAYPASRRSIITAFSTHCFRDEWGNLKSATRILLTLRRHGLSFDLSCQ